jgi:hypothetical protein
MVFEFLSFYYMHISKIPSTTFNHRFVLFFFAERDHYNAPPPITMRESQQNTPPRSNFVSLKRPASTLSKSDSRESPASDKIDDHSNKVYIPFECNH